RKLSGVGQRPGRGAAATPVPELSTGCPQVDLRAVDRVVHRVIGVAHSRVDRRCRLTATGGLAPAGGGWDDGGAQPSRRAVSRSKENCMSEVIDQELADVGVTGLAVMGANLARNLARNG